MRSSTSCSKCDLILQRSHECLFKQNGIMPLLAVQSSLVVWTKHLKGSWMHGHWKEACDTPWKPKAHSIYRDDIADGHDDTVMSCNLLNAEKHQIQHVVDDKTGWILTLMIFPDGELTCIDWNATQDFAWCTIPMDFFSCPRLAYSVMLYSKTTTVSSTGVSLALEKQQYR